MTIRRLTFTTALVVGIIPAFVTPASGEAGEAGEAGEGGEAGSAGDADGGADGDGNSDGVSDSEDKGEEDEDAGLGFSGSLTLDNSVGIGSFYRADSTEIIPALTFILNWKIPGTEAMSLIARQDLTLYGLGSLSAYTDQDPGEDVRAADTLLTWSSGKLFKDELLTGIALSTSLRFYLPTSPGSQTKTLILGIGPGVAAKRKFGFVKLMAATRAKYSAYRFDNSVLTTDSGEGDSGARGVPRAIQGCGGRSNSKLSALREEEVACGGYKNAEWTFYNTFEADFQITRALSASITLMLINAFAFPTDVDENSSGPTQITNSETQRDNTWGIVDVSYAVNDHLDLSVGTSSLQSAMSADGKHLRFPWFDFEGPQSNTTSLYFDVAGSF